VADLSGALRRRQYGRNHAYYFGDQKVPGVTTIKGVLDKGNLLGWAAGAAAQVVANNARVKSGHLIVDGDEMWEELRELDDKLPPAPNIEKLIGALKWRHNVVRDVAANRGTEVHHLAEQLTAGDEIKVPEPLVGHVDAYIDWWKAWKPTNARAEISVGSRRWGGWGGQLDLLCDIEGLGRCLIDLKTSASGVYGDTAIQLAGYRYAQVMLDDAGAEQPMPDIDWCGVLHVRADGCDLYPFRVDDDVLRLFSYCRAVYALWLEPFKEGWPGPAETKPKYADGAWGDSVKGEVIRPEDVRGAA
jgi:hypothetical protein